MILKRIDVHVRLKSYVSAVLALVMAIFGLLRLPRLHYATIGGLFSLVWLGFALLVIASHLHALVQNEPAQRHVPQLMKAEERRRIHRRATQS